MWLEFDEGPALMLHFGMTGAQLCAGLESLLVCRCNTANSQHEVLACAISVAPCCAHGSACLVSMSGSNTPSHGMGQGQWR